MPAPTPFRVQATPAQLARLKSRLQDVDYAEIDLPDADTWAYGMPPRVLKKLVEHWRDKYDWTAWQAKINSFAHYKLRCNDVDVHFIHHPSPRPDAVPLILTHGWPGSFVEFLDVIKPLAEPEAGQQAFHVVVPSLPGYGFSGRPTRKNYAIVETAKAFDELMKSLGYSRYMAQGGDWGSLVTKALAITCPESCRAIHLNMLAFRPPPEDAPIPPLTDAEKSKLAAGAQFNATGTGYQQIQATKPQTLGAALSDSPVGLLAWIGEKFHEWVDLSGGDGDFSPNVSTDVLLTNVMVYYISNCITSSFFLYHYQFLKRLDGRLLGSKILQPVGCSAFPHDIMVPPRSWVQHSCPNLAFWNDPAEGGGHFAALERGHVLVRDLRSFAGLNEVKASLGGKSKL
ncbi:Alpha/Beta hydrolase protein [Hyaloraphidium curvatum]|nr:Alpha/Beta hydrolase protein [Hyaloraphidium curvatum]